MDLLIRRFRKDIVDLLNDTQLPIEVKRLVLLEVMSEIEKKCDDIVKQQLIEEADKNCGQSEVTKNGN